MAPEGSTLVVDPNVYYQAAKNLMNLAGDISTAVTRDLVPGLKTGAGMGGNYPAGAGWNAAYKKHADDVRTAILAYAAGLTHFGDILNIAGYNWDAAEHNANPDPNKGEPPAKPAVGAVTPLAADAFLEIPDPKGDNGAGLVIAPGWQSPTPWTGAPNGRADALALAGTAWDTFAFCNEVLTAPLTLLDVRNSFAVVQAPEVQDIVEALDALKNGVDQISNLAGAIAIKTEAYQSNLVDAKQQLSAAAPGAFPTHPGAQVTATIDNTSVRVSIAASLSIVDILNAAYTFNVTAQSTSLFSDLSKADYAKNGFVASDALSYLPKLQALAELPLLVESGNQNDNSALHGELDNMATWKTPVVPLAEVNLSALDAYGPQMKRWATLAVKYGNEARVDPRLVLAMALQEGAPLRSGVQGDFYEQLSGGPSSYHPNTGVGTAAGIAYDNARLLAGEFGYTKHDDDPSVGNSIGLTNQKVAPFNEVKARYPDKFEGQEFSDLAGNDDLGIKAAAYNLKMLNEGAASQATPEVRAGQPLDQFLGSGYNAGGTLERSQDVATGQGTFLENDKNHEVEHGKSTVNVVALADQILRGSGAYR